jgi:hypothetical protein
MAVPDPLAGNSARFMAVPDHLPANSARFMAMPDPLPKQCQVTESFLELLKS